MYLQRVCWEQGASSSLVGTVLALPDLDSSLSSLPELMLGLRAPPTLLSTSSGGKSTITHISGSGTPARLGSVTHITSFSHASSGGRGGCSIKVSPSSPHQPHHPPHMDCFRVLSWQGSSTLFLPHCTHGETGPERRWLPTFHSRLVAELRPDPSLSATGHVRNCTLYWPKLSIC